jgi:SAM-dependent methyltransferase
MCNVAVTVPSVPALTESRRNAALFGMPLFLGAFLLFLLEPLVAKQILPWFGGSAAVWSTCLVFYQIALLGGYLYAELLTRYLRSGMQAAVHIVLLLTSLVLVPIGPTQRWQAAVPDDPTWRILEMLTATIGLPFLALSATTPLLQAWLARAGYKTPYRFFAVSNFASLAALLAYPVAVEPMLDVSTQRLAWSGVYVVFAVLCAISAWRSRREPAAMPREPATVERVPNVRKLEWFALAACGSMLLLSITNHIDANVAAVPLLWTLPLAVYLLTFILAFGAHSFYNRAVWLRVLAVTLGILAYAIFNINFVEAIQVSIPVFLAGLFACCMFCHGELNRLRPHSADLTEFYLIIAAGGAAGAIFVGLIAPRIFSGVYELPLALCITALLPLIVAWPRERWAARALWIAVFVSMAIVLVQNVKAYRAGTLSLRRSFYGSLRVVESHPGPLEHRTLFHGVITHGQQYLLPPLRYRPTTYYGPDSGIGIVLRECFTGPKRVGIVGLGVGTTAAYGQAGDTFRFYDINPQVIDAAQSLFFYLRETHARVEIVTGDARLSLERETEAPFNVLALDAFSGDAIPVHLLTREAVALYLRRLKANGVLAFHVSNDYLDLAPVVRQLADDAGYKSVLVRNHENDDELVLPADWVLVTNNSGVLTNAAVKLHWEPIAARPDLRIWTDDYSSLVPILKTPPAR